MRLTTFATEKRFSP